MNIKSESFDLVSLNAGENVHHQPKQLWQKIYRNTVSMRKRYY